MVNESVEVKEEIGTFDIQRRAGEGRAPVGRCDFGGDDERAGGYGSEEERGESPDMHRVLNKQLLVVMLWMVRKMLFIPIEKSQHLHIPTAISRHSMLEMQCLPTKLHAYGDFVWDC